MNNSPKHGFSKSSHGSSATLRPRNVRLISFLDDETADFSGASTASIVSPSSESRRSIPFLSQAESSAVGPSLSRPNTSSRKNPSEANEAPHSRSISENLTISSAGLWDSWSSLQGIASTLLGSDVPMPAKGKGKGKSSSAAKPPAWKRPSVSKSIPQSEWGPNTDSFVQLPAGAVEERQALVLAKKREALLLANAHQRPDVNGNYKRRDSSDDLNYCLSPEDISDDALVYIHRIHSSDTLAGVMIKYSCQPEVFRKVNRFWPNDNIQTREYVLLPIDACQLRGRKVENLRFDLLDTVVHSKSSDLLPNISEAPESPFLSDTVTQSNNSSLTDQPTSLDIPEGYTHDSWVELPHFPSPVQVLRIPRRTLGYFPPARRKSTLHSAYTDKVSASSTPRASLDNLRHPPTHAASLNASPVRRPQHLQPIYRPRSASTTSNVQTQAKPNFFSHLRGPGGVGTLRGLRTDPSRPGPGEDPLNRKFAAYLPDLAPPEDFPRTMASLRPTPRMSTDSIRSTDSNSGGGLASDLEGWVRKFAASTISSGTKGGSGSISGPSGSSRMGDLIELETNSDMGLGDGDRDNDGLLSQMAPSLMVSLASGGTSTATEEALLNERFPVRGRVRNAYDKGGSKS